MTQKILLILRYTTIFVKKLAYLLWLPKKLTPDNDAMKIGQIIRKIRQEKKFTLEKLAFQAGTDATNLSRIERDKQNPSSDLLENIAQALQFPVSSLYLMLEQSAAEGVGIQTNTKQASQRIEGFVTKYMLLDAKNQNLLNEFMTSMLKAQDK